jgi:hypothetical protein
VGLEAVPDGLDWVAFSRHYFPGRRRHDLEAISAYHECQHGRRRESRRSRSRPAIGLDEPLLTTAGGAPRVRRVLEQGRSDPMTATTVVVEEPAESALLTLRSAQQLAEEEGLTFAGTPGPGYSEGGDVFAPSIGWTGFAGSPPQVRELGAT